MSRNARVSTGRFRSDGIQFLVDEEEIRRRYTRRQSQSRESSGQTHIRDGAAEVYGADGRNWRGDFNKPSIRVGQSFYDDLRIAGVAIPEGERLI